MTTSISPIQERAVQLLLAGSTVAAAARELGIDRTTIYSWRKNHPSFTFALFKAREVQSEFLADSLQDLATTAVETLREILTSRDVPAAARLRAAQIVLSRASSSTTVEQSVVGPIGPANPQNSTEFDTSCLDEPVEPDQAAPAVQTYRRESSKTGRNEPCPCGSGVKHKRCCGSSISQSSVLAA